ncbi:MAG: glucosamine-6-phosphate deaminase [Alphaproteobacteria bacterium]|nr:glucosamine-6-phosphate deaminase [Alphaproteobacteria bacterium]
MRVIIEPNYEELSLWAAQYIAYRIKKHKPSPKRPFVLGLPSGSTPLGLFKYLAQYYKDGTLSFENVIFFGMTEYAGIGAGDPHGFQYFLWDNFLKFVNVKKEHVYFLNGLTTDFAKECAAYEKNLHKYGGVHLFVGGIGVEGHIAFNEPFSSLTSRTRATMLAQSTIHANSRFFDNDEKKVPTIALTIGIGTMMEAEEILILASGSQKAAAIQATVEGNLTHACPASCLQMHPQSIIACDDAAAAQLSQKTIAYFKELGRHSI